MQPAEAITGNGGIPIMEFDYRTYSEFAPSQLHNGAADTPAMTLSLLDKGFGVAMVRAAGGHWMELHERWFREPLQYNHVAKLFKLYRSLPETPAGTVPKDLCIVNSETSQFRTVNNSGDGVYRGLLYELCRLMPRTGTAYRHVLLKDLLKPGFPTYALTNNNAEIRRLKAKIAAVSKYQKEAATVEATSGNLPEMNAGR